MNSHNVHFVYVFIQIETHYMLQLVVGILTEPTVSISAVEDACSALLSNPKYVGCDIRSNKGQDLWGGGQSKLYPPSCSTIRGGLEGARFTWHENVWDPRRRVWALASGSLLPGHNLCCNYAGIWGFGDRMMVC
jgi:hypothetical protein